MAVIDISEYSAAYIFRNFVPCPKTDLGHFSPHACQLWLHNHTPFIITTYAAEKWALKIKEL
jgi:hypothetical protein